MKLINKLNKTSFSITSLVGALLFSTSTYAIDETESLRQRSQDRPSFTSISLDLSGKSGNSETENFSFGLYQSMRKDKHFGFIMLSREYATSFDVESANNSFAHVRYNYYFEVDQSFEVYAQVNEDNFRSLESRELLGFAYRREVSDAQAFGIGAFTEHEDYLVNDAPITFDQTRMNLYWVYSKQLKEDAFISNTLYYQPNLEEFSDWRAYNKFSITTELTDHIDMQFNVLIEHDSAPVLDVEETDISYGAGFKIAF